MPPGTGTLKQRPRAGMWAGILAVQGSERQELQEGKERTRVAGGTGRRPRPRTAGCSPTLRQVAQSHLPPRLLPWLLRIRELPSLAIVIFPHWAWGGGGSC